MPLVKIGDFYPDYKERIFENKDIKSYSVYSEAEEKIGDVHDILVDESGSFRYLVIDTGFWFFGKQVLLPVGRARVDYARDRVYVMGMSREQAENLPEYRSDMTVDYDYEERVRGVYRPTAQPATQTTPVTPGATNFQEGEVARMEVYEESAEIEKQAFVREEVEVRKEVDRDTVEASETIRREKLDVDTQGNPVVSRNR